MALRDWLSATATPATSATHTEVCGAAVATVATVAVATPSKEAPHAPSATPEQAAALRALVARVAASWPEAERAEALAVALADPADALTCWRALAMDRADAPARIVYPAGPYTSAPLAERDPTDDRRTCLDCANLTATERRCLAAWRGERPSNAGRNYHPIADLLKRCECYRPQPAEADQRKGAERWPYLLTKETP